MLERISRREEFDLFIAWIAISLAFAIIFLRDIGRADPVIVPVYRWNWFYSPRDGP
jgi:hypothetical protein